MLKNVLTEGDIALIIKNTADKHFDYSVGKTCIITRGPFLKFVLEHGEEKICYRICLLNQPVHWQLRTFDVQKEELLKLCSNPQQFNTDESCLE